MQRPKKARREYDNEFKNEAVRLVLESGRPLVQVARDLGVHESLVRKWKNQFLDDPEHAFPGKGRLKPQDEELRRLQRENADLREERAILKKALAIFSRGGR